MYQGDKILDNNPLYFHGKVGTPEKSLADWSPALAIGGYNIGTKNGYTNQDIVYGLAARTLPEGGPALRRLLRRQRRRPARRAGARGQQRGPALLGPHHEGDIGQALVRRGLSGRPDPWRAPPTWASPGPSPRRPA